MTLAALQILLVDDDAGDRLMTQEILARGDVEASVHVAHASAFVTKPGAYAGSAEVLTEIDDFYTSVARLP